jgi:hypothetical protein
MNPISFGISEDLGAIRYVMQCIAKDLLKLNLRRQDDCQTMVLDIIDRVLQIGNEIGNIREPDDAEAPKTPA